jgi:hypothetical protein
VFEAAAVAKRHAVCMVAACVAAMRTDAQLLSACASPVMGIAFGALWVQFFQSRGWRTRVTPRQRRI